MQLLQGEEGLWHISDVKGRTSKKRDVLARASRCPAAGSVFSIAARHLFEVVPEDPGYSVSAFCVGDLAKIKLLKYRKDLDGSIVRIASRTEELNQERLLDAIESVPRLAVGCWHALRILHRCRRSGSCEAMVEGWGSILEMLDVSRQHHSYASMSDCLVLHANGVTAVGGADEPLVPILCLRTRALSFP